MIKAQLLKGFQDVYGNDAELKELICNQIISELKLFGYSPLETPVLEYAEVLMGNIGEDEKLIYNFKDHGERHVAMKYDHTVSLARFVANNHMEIGLPFKRYQLGPSFRADKPQRGRTRQFTQLDLDILGTDEILAEVEILNLIVKCYKKLGFKNIKIQINDRKLVDSIIENLKISESNQKDVFICLDKTDKIGLKAACELMVERGISKEIADKLFEVFNIQGSNKEVLNHLKEFNTTTLSSIIDYADKLGFEENLNINLGVVRGLDYYTGLVFEVVDEQIKIGSFGGGGRYENLCERFTHEKISGIGYSFGIERVMIAMQDLKLDSQMHENKVLIVALDPNYRSNAFALNNKLSNEKIVSEIAFKDSKLAKQIKYAEKKSCNYLILIGDNEVENQTFTLKNLESQEQETLDFDGLIKNLKG